MLEEIVVKSGKEVLDSFFETLSDLEDVDVSLANLLSKMYEDGTLTEKNLVNELQKLRDE